MIYHVTNVIESLNHKHVAFLNYTVFTHNFESEGFTLFKVSKISSAAWVK